jgi:hypothetical protein
MFWTPPQKPTNTFTWRNLDIANTKRKCWTTKYYMDDPKNRPVIALPELTIGQKHLHKSLYKYIGKSAWGK